jgi:hypothetical protein
MPLGAQLNFRNIPVEIHLRKSNLLFALLARICSMTTDLMSALEHGTCLTRKWPLNSHLEYLFRSQMFPVVMSNFQSSRTTLSSPSLVMSPSSFIFTLTKRLHNSESSILLTIILTLEPIQRLGRWIRSSTCNHDLFVCLSKGEGIGGISSSPNGGGKWSWMMVLPPWRRELMACNDKKSSGEISSCCAAILEQPFGKVTLLD